MDRDSMYVASIPAEAREKVTARYGKTGKKRAEYYIGNELVGIREFFPTGEPEGEWPWKNTLKHGTEYHWTEPDKLLSCETYENGKPHGTAYQWADDGRLLGSYTMVHGTGIDLWWQEFDGEVTLSEARYYQDGDWHGFEWWLNADATLSSERHWQHWKLHGIERNWNFHGRLHRGFPRYYIHGERVTKRQYVKACMKDETLPPFRAEDNLPQRTFPAEFAVHLRPGAGA